MIIYLYQTVICFIFRYFQCTAATATTSPTVQIATQGPQSGYLLFKTDDGKYQLLRVGTPVATPQGTKNQNATAAKIAGQRVSIQAVPVVSLCDRILT